MAVDFFMVMVVILFGVCSWRISFLFCVFGVDFLEGGSVSVDGCVFWCGGVFGWECLVGSLKVVISVVSEMRVSCNLEWKYVCLDLL